MYATYPRFLPPITGSQEEGISTSLPTSSLQKAVESNEVTPPASFSPKQKKQVLSHSSEDVHSSPFTRVFALLWMYSMPLKLFLICGAQYTQHSCKLSENESGLPTPIPCYSALEISCLWSDSPVFVIWMHLTAKCKTSRVKCFKDYRQKRTQKSISALFVSIRTCSFALQFLSCSRTSYINISSGAQPSWCTRCSTGAQQKSGNVRNKRVSWRRRTQKPLCLFHVFHPELYCLWLHSILLTSAGKIKDLILTSQATKVRKMQQ